MFKWPAAFFFPCYMLESMQDVNSKQYKALNDNSSTCIILKQDNEKGQ